MKTRTDTIDTSEDAAIDARLVAKFIDQARNDGALVAGGPLCFVGLTPRLTRFLINGYVIRARTRMAGLADPYPAGSEIGNRAHAIHGSETARGECQSLRRLVRVPRG